MLVIVKDKNIKKKIKETVEVSGIVVARTVWKGDDIGTSVGCCRGKGEVT